MNDKHPRQGKAGRPYRADQGATLGGPSPRQRSVIMSADKHYSSFIPAAQEFKGAEFLEIDSLKGMANGVIGQWPELQYLAGHELRFLWKAEGGKKSGAPILGKCVLASGLVEFFGLANWIVWLGADWCRELEFSDEQIEAALYHELLHCELKGKNEDEPGIRGHDFEGFSKEIERYGFWEETLMVARGAVQGRLAFDGAQP